MSTESKKVTKPQAYFLLIFGIAFVIGGFAITEDADAVILFVAGGILLSKVDEKNVADDLKAFESLN